MIDLLKSYLFAHGEKLWLSLVCPLQLFGFANNKLTLFFLVSNNITERILTETVFLRVNPFFRKKIDIRNSCYIELPNLPDFI